MLSISLINHILWTGNFLTYFFLIVLKYEDLVTCNNSTGLENVKNKCIIPDLLFYLYIKACFIMHFILKFLVNERNNFFPVLLFDMFLTTFSNMIFNIGWCWNNWSSRISCWRESLSKWTYICAKWKISCTC